MIYVPEYDWKILTIVNKRENKFEMHQHRNRWICFANIPKRHSEGNRWQTGPKAGFRSGPRKEQTKFLFQTKTFYFDSFHLFF